MTNNSNVATVLFVSSDLMFSSRVVGAAKALGVPLTLVADPTTLGSKVSADCRMAFVDLTLDNLNLPAAVTAIKAGAPAARVIGYGPHVDTALLADANAAGCDVVLTRGQFNQQYAELLRDVTAKS
jgi:hypothetical protein